MRWLLLVMTLALGCMPLGPGRVETPAKVYRWDGMSFIDCTLTLGWTEQQLTSACGEPVAKPTRKAGGSCYLYPTLSRPIAPSEMAPPPYYLVCLEQASREIVTYEGPKRERRVAKSGDFVVTGVYGISEAPVIPP